MGVYTACELIVIVNIEFKPLEKQVLDGDGGCAFLREWTGMAFVSSYRAFETGQDG